MDNIEKIKELHQLLKDGALTEEEFNSEKKKLIGDDDIADAEVIESEVFEAKIIPDLETTAPVAPPTPLTTTAPVSLNEQYAQNQGQETFVETEHVQQQWQQPAAPQTHVHNNITYVQPKGKRANGFAITGFIFSLIGIIPYLGIIFLPFALILSIVGLCLNGKKYKKGLAIAGLIISLLVILAWVAIFFLVNQAYERTYDYGYYGH
jgi:hypothetical protein